MAPNLNVFQQYRTLLAYRPGVVPHDERLRQTLRGWQIFFISITSVIGTGCFTDFARAAAIAGPAGLIIGIALVGSIAIAVVESLSELVQIFPTVNPIVEFVDLFVDPALATCVAVSYWFAYAAFFAVQLTSVASYVTTEQDSTVNKVIRAICFFLVAPAVIIFINLRPVNIFGWIETICGATKIFLVLLISGVLLYGAGQNSSAGNLNLGFSQSNPFNAVCLVIESVAFSFIGVESVAIMSFEARNIVDIKIPSLTIAWATLVLYMVYGITQATCFTQDDLSDQITSLFDQSPRPQKSAVLVAAESITSDSGIVCAMVAILIFCALSCANTTLFISSGTLFGSARYSDHVTSKLVTPFANTNRKGVPRWAVILSGLFWTTWLPFVSLSDSDASAITIAFFTTSGSFCVLFVWGATCLAYIRYWMWFRMFKDDLPSHPTLQKYNRWNHRDHPFGTLLRCLQPGVAMFGLFGSWTLAFIVPSAIWWHQDVNVASFFQCYTSPILVVAGWIILKAFHVTTDPGRDFLDVLYVRQDPNDIDKLVEVVENLTMWLKRGQTVPEEDDVELAWYRWSKPKQAETTADVAPSSSTEEEGQHDRRRSTVNETSTVGDDEATQDDARSESSRSTEPESEYDYT